MRLFSISSAKDGDGRTREDVTFESWRCVCGQANWPCEPVGKKTGHVARTEPPCTRCGRPGPSR